MKRILTVLGLSLLVAACKKPPVPMVQALPLGEDNVAIVQLTSLQSGPVVSGALEARQTAVVRAEIGSTVLRTLVEEGQHVTRGQRLADLDPSAWREAAEGARSAVSSAQLNADLAQKGYDRQKRLAAAGAVAQKDLEAAQSQVQTAMAMLKDAQARFAAANKQLDAAAPMAPFAGVVSHKAVDAGGFVQTGGELFTIVQPGDLQLEASVRPSEVGMLRAGQSVRFDVEGYASGAITGRITRISPAVDPETRQVGIFVTVPAGSARGLVPGVFATGRVVMAGNEVLAVPSAALQFESDTTRASALRIRGGKVERVDVQVGRKDIISELTSIVSGLAVGDTVVRGTVQGVSPGIQVRLVSSSGS